jgi:RNA polymerase sigma-70 factor (ECF subfamily)
VVGEHAADDALQHALVCAWHSLRRRRAVRHARAWLFTIVHRSALQLLREDRTFTGASDREPVHPHSIEDEFEHALDARVALSALAVLPRREREALVGVALEGRSTREVARDLGVAEATARQLVFRARARLRAALRIGASPAVVIFVRVRTFARAIARRVGGALHHGAAPLRSFATPSALAPAVVCVTAGASGVCVLALPHARDHAPARAASAPGAVRRSESGASAEAPPLSERRSSRSSSPSNHSLRGEHSSGQLGATRALTPSSATVALAVSAPLAGAKRAGHSMGHGGAGGTEPPLAGGGLPTSPALRGAGVLGPVREAVGGVVGAATKAAGEAVEDVKLPAVEVGPDGTVVQTALHALEALKTHVL